MTTSSQQAERDPLLSKTSGHPTLERVHSSQPPPASYPAQPVSPGSAHSLHHPRFLPTATRTTPNRLARLRHRFRPELAEVLGTFFILLFGIGVECEVNLHYDLLGHGKSAGDFNSQRFAWAVGVAMGVFVAGGISGAHLNPTVTIALWIFRGFPTRKVLPYLLAQMIGGVLGAAAVYSNYFHSITLKEGSSQSRTVTGPNATAGLFVTSPQGFLDWRSAAWSECLASAVLVCLVFALSDQRGLTPPRGCMPLAMWLLLVGIGASLGINTGYAINFARDTGPRIFLYFVGYGSDIFTSHSYWFLWGPGLASILGGLLGATVYDTMIYTGTDSPLNAPVKSAGGAIRLVEEGQEEEEGNTA